MPATKPVSGKDIRKMRISHEKAEARTEAERKTASSTRSLVCPDYLSPEAKREWERIVAVDSSREIPLIYDSDIAGLIMLCENWAVFIEAQTEWAKTQRVILRQKETNKIIVNPAIAEMNRISKSIMPMYERYGLTPVGRARIAADMAKLGSGNDDDPDFD